MKNFLRAELAFLKHTPVLDSFPYLFRVDPTSRCMLACPYCLRTLSGPAKPAQLALDEFIEGFRPFEEHCLLTSFQLFGEPILNDQLPEMVHHVHERGVATYVSTNLQKDDQDGLARLLSSGLDLLTISLDAATPETYGVMKPGGNYDLLMHNVHFIFRHVRSMQRPPAVGFQVLVTRRNEAELADIRAFSSSMGADYLDLKPVQFLPADWLPSNPKYRMSRYEKRRSNCSMPWTHITLLANGRYFPCCAFPGDFDLGPAGENSHENIWNGPSLQNIREGFRCGQLFSLCRNCPLGRLPRF